MSRGLYNYLRRDLLRPQAYELLCFDAIWISTCLSLGNQYPEWVSERNREKDLPGLVCQLSPPINIFLQEENEKNFKLNLKQIFIRLNLKFCLRIVFVETDSKSERKTFSRFRASHKDEIWQRWHNLGLKKLFIWKKSLRLGCAWNWGLVNRCRHATLGEIEAISGNLTSVELLGLLPDDVSLLWHFSEPKRNSALWKSPWRHFQSLKPSVKSFLIAASQKESFLAKLIIFLRQLSTNIERRNFHQQLGWKLAEFLSKKKVYQLVCSRVREKKKSFRARDEGKAKSFCVFF